jgi:uncharacterized membrane protein
MAPDGVGSGAANLDPRARPPNWWGVGRQPARVEVAARRFEARMSRLRALLEALRANLWFVPALIVLGSVGLAIGLIETDWVSRKVLVARWPRVFGAGADGSRALLSAIAGSMITVAGVTFSITVVVLALASSQYTSRILRTFMRDRANQAVLGVFLGVFAYCLVVLRTIRGGSEGSFVPALAVFGAVVLSFVAIAFLTFFVHHIAASIQVTSIVAVTAGETLRAVERLFPAELGEAVSERAERAQARAIETWVAVCARKTGYVQDVDGGGLLELARAQGVIVRMERGIGEFVIEGTPLVSVGDEEPDERVVRKLTSAFSIGQERTVQQDAAYGIRQLGDIALKALSPSVNDTTTAINAIDYLGAILASLASRRVETPCRSDGGELLVIARGPTFPGLLAEAFDQIRQSTEGTVTVLVRLLEVLRVLRALTDEPNRLRAIEDHTTRILEVADRGVQVLHDRARIQCAARPEDPNPRGVEQIG